MKRQRGQAMLEFALMAPLMFLLIFGAIYGGLIFVDYLNFCNDARTVARKIAVTTDREAREELIENYKKTFDSFYKVTRDVSCTYEKKEVTKNGETSLEDDKDKPIDVVVTVSFERDNKDLPTILYAVDFPPKTFKIMYTMKAE